MGKVHSLLHNIIELFSHIATPA